MEKTSEDSLHGESAIIDIVCDPALQNEVNQYFLSCDVGFAEKICLSVRDVHRYTLVFDLAKKGWEVAKAIMGLFNRYDVEIEMSCASNGRLESVTRVKLRKSDDVEVCKDLLDKCYAISVRQKDVKNGDE